MLDIFISFYYNVVPFLLVLSLLVFVHEMGHYVVARWNGVKVEVFSIGFGPEIFGWTDRKNTRWKVSLIPFGGYVKMFSDLNVASQPDAKAVAKMSEEDKEKSLYHKTVLQRIAVSAAGPIANYLLAIVLLTGLYIAVGQRVPSNEAKVGFVAVGSPAETAGIKTGDEILKVGLREVSLFQEFADEIKLYPDKNVDVQVRREGLLLVLTARPGVNKEGAGFLGVTQGYDMKDVPFYKAPLAAVESAYNITHLTVMTVGKMIIGAESADGLSGPIGIATITGKAAQTGLVDLIWLAAVLSISLGFINILPIPMLDGGHILFYTIEAIRGAPLSEKKQEIGYRIGFAFVIFLLIFATWNDLMRLNVFESIVNLFS